MHFTKKNPSEKRIELTNKLKKQKILRFPGAYNPLTAKLIIQNTKIKKIIEYLLALLLVVTAVIIVID